MSRNQWLLRSLHFLLALSLPLMIVLLVGCIKAKVEPEQLGLEVPADSIDLALSKAVSDATLSNVHVGQFAEYVTVRRIENEEQVTVLGAKRVSVTGKSEAEDTVKYTLQIVKSERQEDGNFETKVTEDVIKLAKQKFFSKPSTATLAAQILAEGDPDEAPTRLTYHNLREWDQNIPAPPQVRAKADCGGLSPCEIPARFISFDLVEWKASGAYQKVHFDFAFSIKTPYLPFGTGFDQMSGLMISDCRSTYIDIGSRTVYLRQCESLEDFQN